MPTTELTGARVATQANVYFEGKCVSHTLTMPDGTRKSVGVVLASTLTFGTSAPEMMECVAGSCQYRMTGTDKWLTCLPGDQFGVPAQSSFDIRVEDHFHYICHYG